MDFTKMNDAELCDAHSEMLATASDLGMSGSYAMAEGQQPTTKDCEELHVAIEQYRAGLNARDEGTATEGATVAAPKRKKKKAAKPAETTTATSVDGDGTTNAEQTESEVTETTTAKKTPAKKAGKKVAKKSAAKKPAAKAGKKAAKKPAKSGAKQTRKDVGYTITAEARKNPPYQAGTERAHQFGLLAKHDSLNDHKKAGGEAWILRLALKSGLAKKKAA
jgi:hypothetical protein